jgi:hypothetical protein
MSRYIFTIGPEHLAGPRANGYRSVERWRLRGTLGRVLPGDIGKRVFEVTSPSGTRFYQVENDEQRNARLARVKP